MNKSCNRCKEYLSIDDFYSNGYDYKGKKKYKPFCKTCEYNRQIENYIAKLIQVKKQLKCLMCGYSKNLAALEFHHVNPEEKEYSISKMKTYSLEKLRKELDKCIILCANCHREKHNPRYNL